MPIQFNAPARWFSATSQDNSHNCPYTALSSSLSLSLYPPLSNAWYTSTCIQCASSAPPFNSAAGKLGFHWARFTASQSQRADSPSSWTEQSHGQDWFCFSWNFILSSAALLSWLVWSFINDSRRRNYFPCTLAKSLKLSGPLQLLQWWLAYMNPHSCSVLIYYSNTKAKTSSWNQGQREKVQGK